MYSAPNIPVDKGLGFDFSQITDLVKGAATVGLGIFNKQMEIKQIKARSQAVANQGFAMPNAGQYGQYSTGLPITPTYGFQPNMPQPIVPTYQSSSNINTGTVLMTGGLVIAGIILFKLIKG